MSLSNSALIAQSTALTLFLFWIYYHCITGHSLAKRLQLRRFRCKWTKKRYLRELGMVYPHLVRTCAKDELVDWPGNEWPKGSYSFPKRGEVTRVGPLLRAGFLKRIHFAGEHTCYAFTGYMEAALQSGIRAAEQIARRDEVLGRRCRQGSRRTRPKKQCTLAAKCCDAQSVLTVREERCCGSDGHRYECCLPRRTIRWLPCEPLPGRLAAFAN